MNPALPHALVTGGGTREPVDDVRWLGNIATGALPAAMAEQLVRRGWRVTYVHGPGAQLPGRRTLTLPLDAWSGDGTVDGAVDGDAGDPAGARGPSAPAMAELLAAWQALAQVEALPPGRLRYCPVTTAAEAGAALTAVCADDPPQLVAAAMAVADFRPRRHAGKLDSADPAALLLPLERNPKLIDALRPLLPQAYLLGFKLLSGADEAAFAHAAAAMAARAQLDAVFCNDMNDVQRGVRAGTLRGRDGAVVAALDGGAGEGATGRLAALLVEAALAGAAAGAALAGATARPASSAARP